MTRWTMCPAALTLTTPRPHHRLTDIGAEVGDGANKGFGFYVVFHFISLYKACYLNGNKYAAADKWI